jgi:hypothetical protein
VSPHSCSSSSPVHAPSPHKKMHIPFVEETRLHAGDVSCALPRTSVLSATPLLSSWPTQPMSSPYSPVVAKDFFASHCGASTPPCSLSATEQEILSLFHHLTTSVPTLVHGATAQAYESTLLDKRGRTHQGSGLGWLERRLASGGRPVREALGQWRSTG